MLLSILIVLLIDHTITISSYYGPSAAACARRPPRAGSRGRGPRRSGKSCRNSYNSCQQFFIVLSLSLLLLVLVILLLLYLLLLLLLFEFNHNNTCYVCYSKSIMNI